MHAMLALNASTPRQRSMTSPVSRATCTYSGLVLQLP